jgi:hypothetical protein
MYVARGRFAYLVSNPGVGDIVAYFVNMITGTVQYGLHTSLEISHVDDNALEIVRAGPRQLEVLPCILTPGPVCVWQHLELQGEGHLGIYLGGCSHVLFEALNRIWLETGSTGWKGRNTDLELNAKHIWQAFNTQGFFGLWGPTAMAGILAALRLSVLLIKATL